MDILFKELKILDLLMFLHNKPFQKSLKFKNQDLETSVKKKFFLVCEEKNTVVNI